MDRKILEKDRMRQLGITTEELTHLVNELLASNKNYGVYVVRNLAMINYIRNRCVPHAMGLLAYEWTDSDELVYGSKHLRFVTPLSLDYAVRGREALMAIDHYVWETASYDEIVKFNRYERMGIVCHPNQSTAA